MDLCSRWFCANRRVCCHIDLLLLLLQKQEVYKTDESFTIEQSMISRDP